MHQYLYSCHSLTPCGMDLTRLKVVDDWKIRMANIWESLVEYPARTELYLQRLVHNCLFFGSDSNSLVWLIPTQFEYLTMALGQERGHQLQEYVSLLIRLQGVYDLDRPLDKVLACGLSEYSIGKEDLKQLQPCGDSQ